MAALSFHKDPPVWAAVALFSHHTGQALALSRLLVAHSASREFGRAVARNATTGGVLPKPWLADLTAGAPSTWLAWTLTRFEIALLRFRGHTTVTGTATLAAIEAPVVGSTLVTEVSNHIVMAIADSCGWFTGECSTLVAGTLTAVLAPNSVAVVAGCTDFTGLAKRVVQAKHTLASDRVTRCGVFGIDVATALAGFTSAANYVWLAKVAGITHVTSISVVSFLAVATDLLSTWRNLAAFSKVI